MFKKTTLSNGLRIITIPTKSTLAVTILVLVGTGSKYETGKENGISHFLEHMFFKGTKKRANTLKIAETLDRVGGVYNAFTSKEYTGYWAKVDSKHLDLALDWVSDIFLNSKLDSKEVEREKGVITEELNMYRDTPQVFVIDLFEKLLYGKQPAGKSIIGEKENIGSFKRKDFLNYTRTHYSSKNTIICLAGNIVEKAALKNVKKFFKNIKTSKPESKLKVEEKQENPKVSIYYKKTDQTHLILGARGFNLSHPSKYAQSILATILGGNMSSRLFISVREREGLAYYIRTSDQLYTDTGYLATQAGIDNKRVERAINLILNEYKKLKEKKVSTTELQKAKDFSKGIMTLALESSEAKASFFANQELLENGTLTPKQIFKEIDKVSTADIQNLAKETFQPEKLNLALVGPFKDKERFEKILKI